MPPRRSRRPRGRLAEAAGMRSADVAGPGFVNLRLEAAAPASSSARSSRRARRTGGRRHWPASGSTSSSSRPTPPARSTSAAPAGPPSATRSAGPARHAGRRGDPRVLLQRPRRPDRPVRPVAGRRARASPTPEDGYAGEYIADIAAAHGVARGRTRCLELPDAEAQRDVPRGRRRPDVRPHQDERCTSSAPTSTSTPTRTRCTPRPRSSQAIDQLREPGNIYEKRRRDAGCAPPTSATTRTASSSRATATPAYIAGDIAYYLDKRERGFDPCIYMLGADHHGYIAPAEGRRGRARRHPGVTVEVLIGQMVNLVRDGQPVRMSKRAGTVDHARRPGRGHRRRRRPLRADPLLGRRPIDIDLALSSRESSENPVYYVQYAHARLSALARNAAELGCAPRRCLRPRAARPSPSEGAADPQPRRVPAGRATAAELREPHRVCPLPRGPRRRLPPVLRPVPGAAAGRRRRDRRRTARDWRCAAPPARSSPTDSRSLGVSAPERM